MTYIAFRNAIFVMVVIQRKGVIFNVRTDNIRRLIDEETGAVVWEKSTSEQTYDWFPDANGFIFGKRGRDFWRVGSMDGLTLNERGVLYTLATKARDDGTLPPRRRMAKLLGLAERQTATYIAALIEAGAIAQNGSLYHLNPTFIFVGYQLPPTLYSLFRADCDRVLTDRAKRKYAHILGETE